MSSLLKAVRRIGPLLALVSVAAGPSGMKARSGEHAAVATTAGALTPLGPQGIKRGYERLNVGQYALAVSRFNAELDAAPDSADAKRGLALALAGARRCGEAMPLLESLRHPVTWDAMLARAEGNCAARSSDFSRSAAAFEEATLLSPHDYEAWYGLVQAEIERDNGEFYDPILDDALAGLEETAWKSGRVPLLVAVAKAWIAYRRNDDPWWALDELRQTIETSRVDARAGRVDADTIEGRLWLDLGDPLQADRLFRRGLRDARRAPRIGAWHAEALRRIGDADGARAVLESGRASLGEHWTKHLIQARWFADFGDLPVAQAEVAKAPPDDPETVATRWYLAAANHDAEAMQREEKRWLSFHRLPTSRLSELYPWS